MSPPPPPRCPPPPAHLHLPTPFLNVYTPKASPLSRPSSLQSPPPHIHAHVRPQAAADTLGTLSYVNRFRTGSCDDGMTVTATWDAGPNGAAAQPLGANSSRCVAAAARARHASLQLPCRGWAVALVVGHAATPCHATLCICCGEACPWPCTPHAEAPRLTTLPSPPAASPPRPRHTCHKSPHAHTAAATGAARRTARLRCAQDEQQEVPRSASLAAPSPSAAPPRAGACSTARHTRPRPPWTHGARRWAPGHMAQTCRQPNLGRSGERRGALARPRQTRCVAGRVALLPRPLVDA